MVLVAGLVSFGVGLVASWAVMRRARAELCRTHPDAQWSWEDWHNADPVVGRWRRLAYVATIAAATVGLYGFGTPNWLRIGLLGVLAGFCLPPFMHGTWLLLRSRRDAPS
jgi:hypothetical protein